MHQPITTTSNLRVSDLVLEPVAYSEALRGPLLRGRLTAEMTKRLSTILPVAIAQLDALGDTYGAIALASLFGRIERLQPAA